jgi:hypothetical protein
MDGSNRFEADGGTGFRGGTADFSSAAGPGQRGGTGAEQGVTSTAIAGNPHSSHGFKRALMKTQRSQSGTLKGDMVNKTHFGGPGFKKPNYFGQGGGRHGMHIGAGAPFTGAAHQEGADF